jgi:glycine cleavage system H protein
MNVPDDLAYSSDHEWAQTSGATVRVGITDYAQDALGDIVFVQLPTVGAAVTQGAVMGEVESTKSVSEIYAPINGTVSAVNEALGESPQLLNEDPYAGGWICEIEPAAESGAASLLDAAAYRALTES